MTNPMVGPLNALLQRVASDVPLFLGGVLNPDKGIDKHVADDVALKNSVMITAGGMIL